MRHPGVGLGTTPPPAAVLGLLVFWTGPPVVAIAAQRIMPSRCSVVKVAHLVRFRLLRGKIPPIPAARRTHAAQRDPPPNSAPGHGERWARSVVGGRSTVPLRGHRRTCPPMAGTSPTPEEGDSMSKGTDPSPGDPPPPSADTADGTPPLADPAADSRAHHPRRGRRPAGPGAPPDGHGHLHGHRPHRPVGAHGRGSRHGIRHPASHAQRTLCANRTRHKGRGGRDTRGRPGTTDPLNTPCPIASSTSGWAPAPTRPRGQ